MAQGKLKVKAQKPAAARKKKSGISTNKNSSKLRKGPKQLAPKKERIREQQNMKKNLEKLIKRKIESSTMDKANLSESIALKLSK